ncbi:hypothetical protein RKLH11_3950 [Rhodobacteraceae bacterium KLH11]|nr:hypothetical protein RKLH11_3950 [Rhodobacteraceae bacterium KLH11]
MRIDILTGKEIGWMGLTVESVEPIRHDRITCRWMVLERDDGERLKIQVANFWADERCEAVGNIVEIHK